MVVTHSLMQSFEFRPFRCFDKPNGKRGCLISFNHIFQYNQRRFSHATKVWRNIQEVWSFGSSSPCTINFLQIMSITFQSFHEDRRIISSHQFSLNNNNHNHFEEILIEMLKFSVFPIKPPIYHHIIQILSFLIHTKFRLRKWLIDYKTGKFMEQNTVLVFLKYSQMKFLRCLRSLSCLCDHSWVGELLFKLAACWDGWRGSVVRGGSE